MKKNNIFWIGYSDLMTSLFFIMLVLFVLSIGHLHVKIKELEKSKAGLINENDRLQKLLNLEKQFAPLIKDNAFDYLPDCKKFVVKDLMNVEIFEPRQTIILPTYITRTLNAGRKIENFLRDLYNTNKQFSYLLIIEGNMANTWDKTILTDSNDGYIISYNRALAVYNLWVSNGIDFRKYNVEVLICGSGYSGLCRDKNEDNNKRFSIQIIPKVSR
jgi:hypothetical protein